MKRSAMIALLIFGLCTAASAQRGRAAGATGRSSASIGRSFSSSGSDATRPAAAPRATYARPQRSVAGTQARRPLFYSRRPVRGYGAGYGSAYPYGLGYIDPGYNYDNNALYDGSGQTSDSMYDTAQTANGGAPDGIMPPPPPGAQPLRRQPPPAPEAAITLIFKDGRPPLQIHNYALTPTTLYVTDPHHREIPVTDLDLPATQKANDNAGITFTLPTAQR